MLYLPCKSFLVKQTPDADAMASHHTSAGFMKKTKAVLLTSLLILTACRGNVSMPSEEKLIRKNYVSSVDQSERDYFVYLPRGYESDSSRSWPLMLFLHGHGERGDGKDELPYVLKHGPVYEAWIRKKNIPFVIVSPQLHMFDFDKQGLTFIDNRRLRDVPERLEDGVPLRPPEFPTPQPMQPAEPVEDMSEVEALLPDGWEKAEQDLLHILEQSQRDFRIDSRQIIITGMSYGGFGTWYMASKHPELFSAMAPVVAWGHPDLVEPIAEHKLPLWVFAGGRDTVIDLKYFYPGLNKIEKLGHKSIRFTIHADMAHDAWTRVYADEALYDWMLKHEKKGP